MEQTPDKTIAILTIENAQTVCDNLSDLLCWWEGFKQGLSLNPDSNHTTIAENGIKQARELRIQIQKQIIK